MKFAKPNYAKCHPDGTVGVNLRYYTIPYHLVGESVLAKISTHTIEIYHKLTKVATHKRLYGHKGQKTGI